MCAIRSSGQDIISFEKLFKVVEESNDSCIEYLNITRSIECLELMCREFHSHKEHYEFLTCKYSVFFIEV